MVASVVCRPSTSSKDFSSETTGSITIIKVHIQHPGNGGKKGYIFGPGHRPRRPPCTYVVKTLKYLLLQNQWVDCLESWYVASEKLVLQIYINDDPGLTWTYFMARSNFGLKVF